MTDEKDNRIAELEDRVKVLEDWAQTTTRWLSVLAQQDALIAAFAGPPENPKALRDYAELIGRADNNYRALNNLINEDDEAQSDQ